MCPMQVEKESGEKPHSELQETVRFAGDPCTRRGALLSCSPSEPGPRGHAPGKPRGNQASGASGSAGCHSDLVSGKKQLRGTESNEQKWMRS